MKTTASIQPSAFFNPTLPVTSVWGESSQRIVRRAPHIPLRFALDTDDLAATKQEVVCAVILALCLVYTLAHVAVQMSF